MKGINGRSGDETFSMIFPPPNVTGNLHLGHALTATIQDVVIRWKRKQGLDTRWIFGTDHAGIATQVVVEKILQKKYGKSRHDIGREDFLKETWKWKHEKGSTIVNDLKKLGATFNWSREYFTLDKNLSHAVNEAFIRLFERGLIYRDKSLINWSCALESAISDIEVENLEITGTTQIAVPNYDKNVTVGVLTDFAYKIVDSEEEIIVSTTRPETMLGDSAVCVHPNDPRYSHLRKNTFLYHPYRHENIPLIFDESVDIDFGTGAVKITPSHDKNDFEVAKRHGLEHIQVITENGCIEKSFTKFANLPRFQAREEILNDLAELQLLRGSKPHNMVLPICSRSKDIVEFMIKPQWFMNCSNLSKRAVEAVESGEIKIIPQNFEKEWYRWLTNCRDWCISRQLWWGHQIPAYRFTSLDQEFWIAAKSQEEAEMKFKIKHPQINEYQVTRDQDVLDTWFSSGLLPFSVFNWPNSNDEDFKKYFPLNLMETGHDILFFWVARMVMLSLELTGKVPFREILLHGILCDAFGRKMSKSLGNVILPDQIIKGATLEDLEKETKMSVEKGILSKLELEKSIEGQKKMFPNGIQECGVDALRFTLCSQNTKQHFINFDVNECVTNKLFFNKIWQATKYAINYAENKDISVKNITDIDSKDLSTMDLWILSRLGNTIKTVKQSNEDYNFHLSTSALKNFFYSNFCDVYLETTKKDLKDINRGYSSATILNLCLYSGLDLMEIYTPYLAQELKKCLPDTTSFNAEKFINDGLENQVNDMLDICASIREAKSHLKLTKKAKCLIVICVKSEEYKKFLAENLSHVNHLTFSENIKIVSDAKVFEENEEFDLKLAAIHICSFGIKLLDGNEISKGTDDVINMKKLKKLEEELLNMLNTVSKDGYKQKANEKVQLKHRDKVSITLRFCFAFTINL